MVEIKHRKTGATLLVVDARTLERAVLPGAALAGAGLSHQSLRDADLRGADLGGASLYYAGLQNATLDGATLVNARLYCVYLAHASLRRADLSGADLRNAVLCHANLSGATLRCADLRCANLLGADLSGADLSGADLSSAVLEGAVLSGVHHSPSTRWPDGLGVSSSSGQPSPPPGWGNRFPRALTRRVGRRRPGTARLWTIQELTVWERLRDCGVLDTDPECIDPYFRPAYEWMAAQMRDRLPGCVSPYPWWAWYRPKPDLRSWHARFSRPGIRRVRLELAVPRESVLLSNGSAWLSVVDRQYLWLDSADCANWEAEIEREGIDEVAWPLPAPWGDRVAASWERVFDFEALAAGGSWSDAVQATFDRLDMAHVVAVTEFTTR